MASLIAILIICILTFSALIIHKGHKKNGKILFDVTHGNTQSPLLDFNKDISNSTIFGHARLVELLKVYGFKVCFTDNSLNKGNNVIEESYPYNNEERFPPDKKKEELSSGSITPKLLEDVSVLVLIMPSKGYSEEETGAIRTFVAKGGGLLAIGDHSNISNCMSSLNPVTGEFGIRLRFDTIWLQINDRKDILYRYHPTNLEIEKLNFSVGASLDITRPASSILQSNFMCYSDTGDPNNADNGYLGNSMLDSTERIHDLCLIAESRYGKGRVLVLGDSSYFQNTSLYQNTLFAYRLFDWLNHYETGFLKDYTTFIRIASCIILLSLIVWLLPSPLFPILLLLIIGAMWGAGFYNIRQMPQPDIQLPTVLIDMAHQNEYTPYWISREKSELGIDGLIDQIVRCGFYPVIRDDRPFRLKELKRHKAIIIICPNIPFSNREMGDIETYVNKGGGILIVEGPRKWANSSGLWDSLGIYKDRYPLSAISPIQSPFGLPIRLAYGEFFAQFIPHPVTNGLLRLKMVNPSKVYGGLPIAFVLNTPVINFKELGDGKIVAIGDDRFFANYNTEFDGKIMDYNKIRMLWNILDYIVKN